ncbi:MAG: PTS sugar transporter subunit IIB [Longicatena sp.]
MITIARIDERLIHGQVAYAWAVSCKSQIIMAVDNEISKDAFQISLLEMACPTGTKCLVVNEDKAVRFLQNNEKKKFFLVVKHPITLLHLIEKGIKLESINVGGLYFKEGRKQLTKTVYVDDEMISIFKKLNTYQVKLETRATPSDALNDLMKLL